MAKQDLQHAPTDVQIEKARAEKFAALEARVAVLEKAASEKAGK